MGAKLADYLLGFAIFGILVGMLAPNIVDFGEKVDGIIENGIAIVSFTSIVIILIYALFCLGHAIDMPKSTEKNLWILGILFATPIIVPYFYFKYISKKNE